jgi:hypothetical protein
MGRHGTGVFLPRPDGHLSCQDICVSCPSLLSTVSYARFVQSDAVLHGRLTHAVLMPPDEQHDHEVPENHSRERAPYHQRSLPVARHRSAP